MVSRAYSRCPWIRKWRKYLTGDELTISLVFISLSILKQQQRPKFTYGTKASKPQVHVNHIWSHVWVRYKLEIPVCLKTEITNGGISMGLFHLLSQLAYATCNCMAHYYGKHPRLLHWLELRHRYLQYLWYQPVQNVHRKSLNGWSELIVLWLLCIVTASTAQSLATVLLSFSCFHRPAPPLYK